MNFLMVQIRNNSRENRRKDMEVGINKIINYFFGSILFLSLLMFLCVSFGSVNIDFSKDPLLWLIISGGLIGLYYGLFNDLIFHYPDKPKSEYRNEFAITNTLWVHLFCGLITGTLSYFFMSSIRNNQMNSREIGFPQLVLLVIILLGYCGLLPRTLWFISNSGKLLGK